MAPEENQNEKKNEQNEHLEEEQKLIIPTELPLLPVRDMVIFPFMILPLFVGRENSINGVNEALSKDRLILLSAQKDPALEEPGPEDIYSLGTVCMIMRMLKLPDGRLKILVQGLQRAEIKEFLQEKPFLKVRVETIQEPEHVEKTLELEALMRTIKQGLNQAMNMGKVLAPDIMVVLDTIEHPGRFADLVASNIGLSVQNAQEVLSIIDPGMRLRKVNELLSKEIELLDMQQRIQSQAKEEISKTQREYFLREQLKAIKQELGESDEREAEINEFRKKIEEAGMPEEALKEANNQLGKLERMHPDAIEAGMVRSYLEWLVELPWSKMTEDQLDVKKAKEILDEDHFDLEKVKDRILEHIAVLKLSPQMRGPILCFVGPPGVGKTSLGKSIARAMGRKFVRISLGGIKDEAEIRGHRRTYVGSMPGRIIQGMKQAGSRNPIFMLDEIDKVGMDFRGDPASALLEVLDPEQNFSFRDHYLNLEFDLSKVMFITTANLVEPIPPALKDRMEMLSLPGYITEEKVEIAQRYLLPRQIKENGIKPEDIKISKSVIEYIILHYTREAGVRNLERSIGSLCRKVARRIAEGEQPPFTITINSVHKYLGPPQFQVEEEFGKNEIGVAIGLAWTPTGGEILRVESTIMKGKGNLTLTGHLGEVMRESAQAALSYARSHAEELEIPSDFFETHDIHLHVPAGAIPKDGPSAGVTMAASLISVLTEIPVRKDVAMTGEITLRGRVLPIGGLKEKSLAALRVGIKNIVCPDRNKKDLEEIPPNLRKKMKFIFVSDISQVLDAVLEKEPEGKRTLRRKIAEMAEASLKNAEE